MARHLTQGVDVGAPGRIVFLRLAESKDGAFEVVGVEVLVEGGCDSSDNLAGVAFGAVCSGYFLVADAVGGHFLALRAGGADAVSLINTITGMKIDINRRTFAVANKTGGMSGPAVKPVAVRMVYQVANAVRLPIIGMGGIATAEDALEFIMAGASAVAVGTANFHNPTATVEIVDGIAAYMKKNNIEDIHELIGCVK